MVRGDHWEWKAQDGVEGGVGTVVEVGGRDGSKNPDKTVVVVWDTGVRAKYRAGYDDKYDLRVLDSAPAGSVYSQQHFASLANLFISSSPGFKNVIESPPN